jgi:hypothetical protein
VKLIGVERNVRLIVVEFISHFYFVGVLCVNLQEHKDNHDESEQSSNVRKCTIDFLVFTSYIPRNMRLPNLDMCVLIPKDP